MVDILFFLGKNLWFTKEKRKNLLLHFINATIDKNPIGGFSRVFKTHPKLYLQPHFLNTAQTWSIVAF